MPFNLSAVEKFENYVSMHPDECSGKSAYEICTSIMNMSEKELEEIKNNRFLLPFQYAMQEETPSFFDFNKLQNPVNKEKKKTVYPHSGVAETDENGRINIEEFKLTELQKKYNKKDYSITQDPQSGKIRVKSKKDGKTLLTVDTKNDGLRIIINYYKNSETKESLICDSFGQVRTYKKHVKTKDGGVQTTLYKNGKTTPKSITKINKDETQETIYDKNGKLECIRLYRPEDKTNSYAEKYYSDGKLYKTRVEGKTEYPIVDDLVKIFTDKSYLTPDKVTKISSNILKRLNSKNGNEIAEAYERRTGHDLLDDIKELNLSKQIKEKLVSHVESVAGSCLAKEIFKDIRWPGSGDLMKHIKKINVDNIKDVLETYRILSFLKFDGGMRFINNVSSIAKNTILEPDEGFKKDVVSIIRPYEGLLSAIDDEIGLGNWRHKLIQHVIDTALKNCAPDTRRAALKDINEHKKDYKLVEIDLYRAINIEGGDISEQNVDSPKIKTRNNTYDGPVIQGKLGDCWLLAAINSALAKPGGKEKLEKLVVYNNLTDTYDITFNGLGEIYTVKGSDFEGRSFISSGSKKIQAIEYALDLYYKEKAYYNDNIIPILQDGTFKNVDIVGGESINCWKALFGNTLDKNIANIDCMTEDYNNPNRLYSMWLRSDKKIPNRRVAGLAKTSNGKEYTFVSNHEISIIGSDKNNIYLKDPHDSSEYVIISRANFAKLNAGSCFYTLR